MESLGMPINAWRWRALSGSFVGSLVGGAVVGLVATIGLLPAAAAASDRPWARYAEVQSIFARFEALLPEQRSYLQFRVRATPGDGGAEPVRLKIQTRNGVLAVPITDGYLKLPGDAALLRENPMITTSLPTGTPLLLRPELLFAPLPAPGVTIAGLAARLDQANRAVRAQSGVWALFAPRARSVELVFADPATRVSLNHQGRVTRLIPDSQGRVLIKPDRRTTKAELLYASGPVLVRPVFAGTMVLRAGED